MGEGLNEVTARPRVIAVCGLAFEAGIAAGPGVYTVCGPGPVRVAARLAVALSAGGARPDRGPPWGGIISFGCAGALDPDLAPGSCVVADGVLAGGEVIAADPGWTRALRASLPGARAGLVAGLDAPLASSGAKARLWTDSGACAVDMESHAAAWAARCHGLPFAMCRVVLDPARRSLPPCALAAMRMDGSAALAPLLRGLAADPRQLASLCALAREAWLARRALRGVRARIGPALALPGAELRR